MVKFLVSGALLNDESSLSSLENKLGKLNGSPHGPFDAVFCPSVSSHALEQLKLMARPLPIPFYFLLSDSCASTDFESVSDLLFESEKAKSINCHYLGISGIKAIQGLKVAYLCGSVKCKGKEAISEAMRSLQESLSNQGSDSIVDILLTHDWPAGILLGLDKDSLPPHTASMLLKGSGYINKVVTISAPRYHFVHGGPEFFQRPPFQLTAFNRTITTRFIAMAQVTTEDAKGLEKWLHALGIEPGSTMDKEKLQESPPGMTRNPFEASHPPFPRPPIPPNTSSSASSVSSASISNQRAAELVREAESGASSSQYFWNVRNQRGGPRDGQGGRQENRKRERDGEVKPPPDCWFCLSSPRVGKHLIVSIGAESYLAMPKGGVSPDHVLIAPIQHYPSLSVASKECWDEAWQFVDALQAVFRKQGKGTVVFERVLYRGGRTDVPLHTHLQVIAIPNEVMSRAASTFEEEGKYRAVHLTRLPSNEDLLSAVRQKRLDKEQTGDFSPVEYFYVECRSSDISEDPVRLINFVEPKAPHPLQFGREVLCRLIGVPDRITWKNCVLSEEEETKQTNEFRATFEPFDFTLTL